jgi:D-glycero-alpha-D-manno-heptose-7-phosphate kinase
VAYSGVPHVSSDINGEWIRQFLAGKYRKQWEEIISFSRRFADALGKNDIGSAVDAMNAEVAIRRRLTPAVLDDMGNRLVAAAVEADCGARFTGAGGGGCLWALGDVERIRTLKTTWQEILSTRPTGQLIEHSIDDKGVVIG